MNRINIGEPVFINISFVSAKEASCGSCIQFPSEKISKSYNISL